MRVVVMEPFGVLVLCKICIPLRALPRSLRENMFDRHHSVLVTYAAGISEVLVQSQQDILGLRGIPVDFTV